MLGEYGEKAVSMATRRRRRRMMDGEPQAVARLRRDRKSLPGLVALRLCAAAVANGHKCIVHIFSFAFLDEIL